MEHYKEHTETTINIQPGVSRTGAVETIQTIREGQMPPNQHLVSSLEAAQRAMAAVDINNPRGQRLAEDTSQMFETAKRLILEKNPDQKIQELVSHSKATSADLRTGGRKIHFFGSSETLNKAENVAWMLIKSSQYRKTLTELVITVQKILSTEQIISTTTTTTPVATTTVTPLPPVVVPTAPPTVAVPAPPAVQTIPIPPPLPTVTTTTPAATMITPAVNQVVVEQPVATTTTYGTVTQTTSSLNPTTLILIAHIKDLIKEISLHPEWKIATDSMIELLWEFREATNYLQSTSAAYQQMWVDCKEIIEQFSGKSLDRFVQVCSSLVELTKTEAAFNTIFTSIWTYYNAVMTDPLVADSEHRNAQLQDLVIQSRDLFRQPRFRIYVDFALEEARDILVRIRDDSSRQDFEATLTKFVKDLTIDSRTGRPSIAALHESLTQMKGLLIPIFLAEFEDIPIQRVEMLSPKYDMILENLLFSGSDLLPEHIRIKMDSDMEMNLRAPMNDIMKAKLTFKMFCQIFKSFTSNYHSQNIQTKLNNVAFRYKRKTLPRYSDQGIVDVQVLGSATSIKIKWDVFSYPNKPMRFVLRKTTCHIDDLRVHIREAKHELLDKVITKLFGANLRKKMEREVERNLDSIGNSIANMFNSALKSITAPTELPAVTPMAVPPVVTSTTTTTSTTTVL